MKKVLIVDDSTMDRKLAGGILKQSGIGLDILEASDGEEGLAVLGKNFAEICLILLDWQMPNIDGIEFMRAVKNVPSVATIPIVMITASGSEDNKRHAFETNPRLSRYIVKPYQPQELMEAVREII